MLKLNIKKLSTINMMITYKRAGTLFNIIINHKSITLKPGTNSTRKSKSVDIANYAVTMKNLHKYGRRYNINHQKR